MRKLRLPLGSVIALCVGLASLPVGCSSDSDASSGTDVEDDDDAADDDADAADDDASDDQADDSSADDDTADDDTADDTAADDSDCVDGADCPAQDDDSANPDPPWTVGPQFPGSGTGFEPLTPGCGPETADQCTGTCEAEGGDPDVVVERPPATLCFGEEGADEPAVVIEQVVEAVDGQDYVHIRITFNPDFVDNTFGEGSIGWDNRKNGHTHKDLVGSDHAVILITDASGETVMEIKLDYLSEDPDAPCGFSAGGVSEGDGEVLQGDPEHVLAATTSLNRNKNYCGFDECFDESSPLTDENFSPNPDTPEWDYRVVYEVWISVEAFGDEGFGQAFMTSVHASPSKTDNHTIEVVPTDCPPPDDEDPPPDECPVNYTLLSSEGKECCVPIPFAGYDGMQPCPTGYMLDLASEGRYCVPEDGNDDAMCTPAE